MEFQKWNATTLAHLSARHYRLFALAPSPLTERKPSNLHMAADYVNCLQTMGLVCGHHIHTLVGGRVLLKWYCTYTDKFYKLVYS